MPLGILGRLKRLETRLNPANRYIDIAIQLAVYDRKDGNLAPTGEVSRIYGGRYDSWTGTYSADAPKNVRVRPVTKRQFNYCLADKFRVTAKGGRGGGKTEALAQKVECHLLEHPGQHGLVVSPDYPHTEIVWTALLPRIHEWLLPGSMGINRTKHQLRLVTGSTLQFLSADRTKTLRGYNAHWMCVDEEKDVTDEALETAMLCCRLSNKPIVWGAGTPEAGGEYEARYKAIADPENPDGEVHSFPSLDNIFIPPDVYEKMKRFMDEKRYRQEVLAEFVVMEDMTLVAYNFERQKHCIEHVPDIAVDVTHDATRRRLRLSREYVAGVDYNLDYPSYAVIYKIYAGRPRQWIAVDVIKAAGYASRLGQKMIDRGYKPSNTVVIDDASGSYDGRHGKRDPNSSTRLMRSLGFKCFHKKQNPQVKDRVNSFLVKLAPLKGPPSWSCMLPKCEELAETCEKLEWAGDGNYLDKSEGYDHPFDAMTYPVAYFEPAARLQVPRLRGMVAR